MTNTLTTITKALTKVPKYVFGNFVVPMSPVIKFPIAFHYLINRINAMFKEIHIPAVIRIFDCDDAGIANAKRTLQGMGGIYLWWCKQTGLFYVGSAKHFWGKTGRLNSYLRKSKLVGPNPQICTDLAFDLLQYPMKQYPWKLIILEEYPSSEMTRPFLLSREQIWMGLLPTYNRSLVAHSSSGAPMPETERLSLLDLTWIWTYTVIDGAIVLGSQIAWPGVKYLIRQGIKDPVTNVTKFPINTSITLSIHSGIPWNNILFCNAPMSEIEQANYTVPAPNDPSQATSADRRSRDVYVYSHPDVLTDPVSAFISDWSNITVCREHFGISRTHFKQIRKFNYPYQGKLFSNVKLH